MACNLFIWGLMAFGCGVQVLLAVSEDDPLEYMSKEEREALKFVLIFNTGLHYSCVCIVCIMFSFFLLGKKPGICFVMPIMLTW